MKKKEMFLQVLWERGHSDLWKFDLQRKGIIFNCFDVTTSMQVGGFAVTGEGAKKSAERQVDKNTTTWQVFVPWGVTAFLDFHSGWDVAVLCTFHGPLEIVSEWFGGGESCYQCLVTLPNGEVLDIDNIDSNPDVETIAAHWEAAYQNNEVAIGDRFVKIKFQG